MNMLYHKAINIIQFLKNRNWEVDKELSEDVDFVILYPPEEESLGSSFNIKLFVNDKYRDIERHISDVILLLNQLYDNSISDLQTIINNNTTVFKIRAFDSENKDGKISLGKLNSLIQNCEKALRDIVKFLITNEVKFANQIKPKESKEYLNLCNFLQTEKGSFVCKIELPNNDKLSSSFSALEASDITTKFFDILLFINEQILNQRQEIPINELLFERYGSLINIDVFNNFKGLLKSDIDNLEFKISSLSYEKTVIAQNIKEKNPKLSSFIKGVQEYLKDTKVDTVQNCSIITLESKDPSSDRNKVKGFTIYDGCVYKVNIIMDRNQYHDAIKAHSQKKSINIEGKFKTQNDTLTFLEVNSVEVNI